MVAVRSVLYCNRAIDDSSISDYVMMKIILPSSEAHRAIDNYVVLECPGAFRLCGYICNPDFRPEETGAFQPFPTCIYHHIPPTDIPIPESQYEPTGAERWRDNCERGWNDGRGRFCEVRSYTIAPAGKIAVDGGDNGGVRFYGSDRRDIKVVARIQASGEDDATASSIARQIRVFTDGGRIRSEGPSTRGRASWSVSYDIYVPGQTSLEADTQNGGISAEDVRGDMDFEATNGGIRLTDVGATFGHERPMAA